MAGDGYYDVAGINANAAKLTHTQTSSSKTQSQSASGDTTGSVNATISKQDSNSKTTRTTHVASDVDLGNTTGSLGDVASIGSNVHLTVQDPSQVQINSITVQSLQDSIQSKNQSKGGSVGVGYKSGSVGYNQSKGFEDTLQTNHIANITIDGNADLDAMGVKDVNITGGVLTSGTRVVDETTGKAMFNDAGTLNYSGNLTTQDLKDHSTTEQRGMNLGFSLSTTKDKGEQEKGTIGGSSNIGVNHTGRETESTVKATLGKGTIANASDILNRDVNDTVEVTRDQITEALDANITVDNRLFSEAGRVQMIDEQKDIGKNFQKTGNLTGSAISKGILIGTEVFVDDDQKAKEIAAKIEDKVGFWGIIPTTLNHGGIIYNQSVITLGADDIDQKQLVAAPVGSDYIKNHPEIEFISITEIAGYDLLSAEKKLEMKGMMVSKNPVKIDATTATYQNGTNGMNNTEAAALHNVLTQTKDDGNDYLFTLNYNPTHGFLADGIESGQDKAAINLKQKWLTTSVADQTGIFLNDVMLARGKQGANFANHSQGNLLTSAGLLSIGVDTGVIAFIETEKGKLFNFTFNMYGSPVNNLYANDQLKDSGLLLKSSTVNASDSVGEFLGGNFGSYVATGNAEIDAKALEMTQNGLGNKIIAGIKFPLLFTDKSTHSTYSCVANCGAQNPNFTQVDTANQETNK